MAGWEPAEVTTYEYDGDRLVSAVTVRESEWSVDDVAALIAVRRQAAIKRSPTGYTIADATNPANRDVFYVKRNAFGVPLPKQDYAMKALVQAQADYYTAFPTAKGDASYVWPVLRRDDSPQSE